VANGSEDRLTGGADADMFVIRAVPGGIQTIMDFELGTDVLDLTAFGFADAEAVAAAADDTASGHVGFGLGGGQTLLVLNVTSAGLMDDLLF